MKRELKRVPKFKDEGEELAFWSKRSSSNFIDWSKSKRVIFPNLKPTSRSISIRLPVSLLERLKFLANKKDVAYQSLIKLFLGERIDKELR